MPWNTTQPDFTPKVQPMAATPNTPPATTSDGMNTPHESVSTPVITSGTNSANTQIDNRPPIDTTYHPGNISPTSPPALQSLGSNDPSQMLPSQRNQPAGFPPSSPPAATQQPTQTGVATPLQPVTASNVPPSSGNMDDLRKELDDHGDTQALVDPNQANQLVSSPLISNDISDPMPPSKGMGEDQDEFLHVYAPGGAAEDLEKYGDAPTTGYLSSLLNSIPATGLSAAMGASVLGYGGQALSQLMNAALDSPAQLQESQQKSQLGNTGNVSLHSSASGRVSSGLSYEKRDAQQEDQLGLAASSHWAHVLPHIGRTLLGAGSIVAPYGGLKLARYAVGKYHDAKLNNYMDTLDFRNKAANPVSIIPKRQDPIQIIQKVS